MTPDILAEAKRLERERTPGPWGVQMDDNEQPNIYADALWLALLPHQCVKSIKDSQDTNAAFIAFCGTHMGTLLAMVQEDVEYRRQREEERDELDELIDTWPTCATVQPKYGAVEYVRDAMADLQADRDRLTAEVERLGADFQALNQSWSEINIKREQAEAEVTRLTAENRRLTLKQEQFDKLTHEERQHAPSVALVSADAAYDRKCEELKARDFDITVLCKEVTRLTARWEALKAELVDFATQPDGEPYRLGAKVMARTFQSKMAELEHSK